MQVSTNINESLLAELVKLVSTVRWQSHFTANAGSYCINTTVSHCPACQYYNHRSIYSQLILLNIQL